MPRFVKYGLAVAAVAAWLAFALSPKGGGPRSDPGPPDLDHAGLSLSELAGEALTRDEALGLPAAAEVVGDYLVVVDRGGATPLHSVHVPTGRLVSFGREGEGPGEFQAPWALDPVSGESAFWVWDVGLQRLTLVQLDGARPSRPLRESPTLPLRSSAAVTGVVRREDGGWVALGLFTGGRLGEFDEEGRLRGEREPLPEADDDLPVQVLQQAYDGRIETRPDRRLVAVGVRKAGRIEIYDLAEGSMRLARVPYAFEPRFGIRERAGEPAMATGDDVRYGYVDLAATPTRLYGLFSGRTPAGYPDRPTFGEYVHVFDWEGEFLGALRLREAAIALAVDERAGRLYAVSHDPTPAIWRYELPEADADAP